MKINTISAYVLVYLLARGHWNLMVPVRADEEANAGSASAEGSVAVPAGGAAEGSGLAAPAGNEGSTAGTDAGSTAGDGSGHVASGEAADSGSSTEASTDADAGSTTGEPAEGESAKAGSSAEASTDADAGQAEAGEVLLNGMYPDFYTGGMSADEAPKTNPELIAKRKEEARRLADDMRKAAEELIKRADELSTTINATTEDLYELNTKMDAAAYTARVESSQLKESADPLDMMYYSGFPNGHHGRVQGALDLIREYKNDTSYYTGFPDGWHRHDEGAEDQFAEREKARMNGMMYYSGFPDGWHSFDFGLRYKTLKHLLEVGIKDNRDQKDANEVEIEAKKARLAHLHDFIMETIKHLKELKEEHMKLDGEVKKLEAENRKLEEERRQLDRELDDVEGRFKPESQISIDEIQFASAAFTVPGLGLDDPVGLRMFKLDADGDTVLMDENDYDKKTTYGDDRFEFKSGVKCVKVMFGTAEVWKKGEQSVEEPKSVTFRPTFNSIILREGNNIVNFKKDRATGNWAYDRTTIVSASSKSAKTATHTGLTASSLSSSSGALGSTLNLETASTGSGDADETSSVTSEAPELNEVDSASSTLRGAGAAAE